MKKVPMREKILRALEHHRDQVLLATAILGSTEDFEEGMTTTQITLRVCAQLDSVSSLLNKMVTSGELTREGGKGPRGGYVYRLTTSSKLTVRRKTAWERIRRA